MIIQVCGIRCDLLEGTEEIFIDGPGIYLHDRLSAAECPPYSGIDTLRFEENAIILSHRGETESRLTIPYEGKGNAVIASPFGEMELETELMELEREPFKIILGYRLIQDGRDVGKFRLRFELTPDEKAELA